MFLGTLKRSTRRAHLHVESVSKPNEPLSYLVVQTDAEALEDVEVQKTEAKDGASTQGYKSLLLLISEEYIVVHIYVSVFVFLNFQKKYLRRSPFRRSLSSRSKFYRRRESLEA